jgi:hypothetical protein
MGIDIQLRVHEDVLAEVGDQKMVLSRAARSTALAQTRLLKYITPWGDTMFSQAQAEDLAADIAQLCRSNADPHLVDMLTRVALLVTQLSQEAHGQLWFIGD